MNEVIHRKREKKARTAELEMFFFLFFISFGRCLLSGFMNVNVRFFLNYICAKNIGIKNVCNFACAAFSFHENDGLDVPMKYAQRKFQFNIHNKKNNIEYNFP